MEENKNRRVILTEAATIFVWSSIFAKLVLFKHYGRFNLPIKGILTYLYTATIEPVPLFLGYLANR